MDTIFSLQYVLKCFPKLMEYLPLTFGVAFVSLIIGTIFGMILTWAGQQKNKIIKGLAKAYIEAIRGTPFLVLLLVVFYGMPAFFRGWGINLDNKPKAFFVIVALSLYVASRISEVLRSAYEAVDHGQAEAACSVGLSGLQSMFHIIAPQAFYIALPNLGSLVIEVILETAIGFTIGLVDLLGKAKLLNTVSYGVHTLEIYIATALIYWGITLLITKLTSILEKSFGRRMGIKMYQMKAAK